MNPYQALHSSWALSGFTVLSLIKTYSGHAYNDAWNKGDVQLLR